MLEYDANDVLFLGRGTGYPIALEGALKLKEIEDACGVRVAMSKPKFQGSMTV